MVVDGRPFCDADHPSAVAGAAVAVAAAGAVAAVVGAAVAAVAGAAVVLPLLPHPVVHPVAVAAAGADDVHVV